MSDMPKTLFKYDVIAFALGIALIALGACTAPPGQEQKEPFEPAASIVDKAGMYGVGESVEVAGILSTGKDRPEGNALSVGYPSITKSTSLPDGVSVTDFRGGAFDDSSASAMKDQLGFAPDSDGKLPEGCSYVLVEETIKNNTDEVVSLDVSRARFVMVDESGGISDAGTHDPLWHDAWDGNNLKQYWTVPIEAGSSLDVRILYALPDDAIDSEGLAYLVDPGNANGEEGFVGLKAFDIAGQVQEQGAI
ncbi:hypothetical protein [Eggerthella sinensis]|uniref:hypothetical protein n=1 Tax=Eggerthella sinensis TaxID=242230 RepID=UPI00266D3A2D|nr:hypothetical protein [Eggerthella sinensis]